MLTIANMWNLTKPDMNTTNCDVWMLSKVVMGLSISRSAGGSFETSTRKGAFGFLKPIKKGSASSATLYHDELSKNSCLGQPFGSMPRCCSSLRIIRLIQAAKDSSPSFCWASSIMSRSSGSRRNWNGGLPRLSFLCIDTLITPNVMCLCVVTHYTHEKQKAKTRSARTLTGLLTTNAKQTSEEAMKNSTTPPRPAFTWLFLATPLDMPHVQPTVVRVEADTEEHATALLPAFSLVFAAKIRTIAPFRFQMFRGDDCFSFTYEQYGYHQGNISSMEVNHA